MLQCNTFGETPYIDIYPDPGTPTHPKLANRADIDPPAAQEQPEDPKNRHQPPPENCPDPNQMRQFVDVIRQCCSLKQYLGGF